jgi:hypothetical protein
MLATLTDKKTQKLQCVRSASVTADNSDPLLFNPPALENMTLS